MALIRVEKAALALDRASAVASLGNSDLSVRAPSLPFEVIFNQFECQKMVQIDSFSEGII